MNFEEAMQALSWRPEMAEVLKMSQIIQRDTVT
jgi:hypothetical protein